MATKHETGAVKIPKRRSLERPNWAAGVLSTLWLLVVVVPLYIMVKASIEDKPHYSEEGPLSLPTMFTLDNYTNALDQGFLQAFINTAIVTVSVVAIVLIVVPPLAFAIVRSRSKFVNGVFQIMLLGIAIPVQAIIVPLFFMIRSVGLYDNLISVIVASAAFSIPMCTIVLTASMRQITNELYEAMSVDGASVDETVLHPVGFIAATAEGSLAAMHSQEPDALDNAIRWVRLLWDTPIRTGTRRYYDNFLYAFAFLALAGEYRTW